MICQDEPGCLGRVGEISRSQTNPRTMSNQVRIYVRMALWRGALYRVPAVRQRCSLVRRAMEKVSVREVVA